MPKMTADHSREQEVEFMEKTKTAWGAVIEQVPSVLAKAPTYVRREEGLGSADKVTTAWGTVIEQRAGVHRARSAVFAGLGAGTVAVLGGLRSLEAALSTGWYSTCELTWAPQLGLAFSPRESPTSLSWKEFCNIYPGRGAWSAWYLPGTCSFSARWAGIAELEGGVGLALGGLGVSAEFRLAKASAAGLFALVLAVTLANISWSLTGHNFRRA